MYPITRKSSILLSTLVGIAGLTAALQAPSQGQTYHFRPIVVISGSTTPTGFVTDPLTLVQVPNRTFINLFIAKETTLGFSYGRMVMADASGSSLSSATVTVNWANITASSATFRYRVLYKIATDQAVYSIVHENTVVDPDPNKAHPERWRLDVSFWNWAMTIKYASRPRVYLHPEDVALTP